MAKNEAEHSNIEVRKMPELSQTRTVGIYALPCPVCHGEMVYVVSIRTRESVDDYCYCYECRASVIVSQYILRDENGPI